MTMKCVKHLILCGFMCPCRTLCPAMTRKNIHGPNLRQCWEMAHEPPYLGLSSCRAFHSLLSALIWRFCAISAKRRPLKFPRQSTYDRFRFLLTKQLASGCVWHVACSLFAIYRFLQITLISQSSNYIEIIFLQLLVCVLISYSLLLVWFSSNKTHPFLCSKVASKGDKTAMRCPSCGILALRYSASQWWFQTDMKTLRISKQKLELWSMKNPEQVRHNAQQKSGINSMRSIPFSEAERITYILCKYSRKKK